MTELKGIDDLSDQEREKINEIETLREKLDNEVEQKKE